MAAVLEKHMHADVKPLNMLVSNNLGKLIDFGFLRQYADLGAFDYWALKRKTHYDFWPLVFANLVKEDNGVETPKVPKEELTEIFESVDKHGFAVTLIFEVDSWPRFKAASWELFKDIAGPKRLYKCEHIRPNANNTEYDKYYDTPFYSWPRIWENLQRFFKDNFNVETPVLDESYLDVRSTQPLARPSLAVVLPSKQESKQKARLSSELWEEFGPPDLDYQPEEGSQDVPRLVRNHNREHGFSSSHETSSSSQKSLPTRQVRPTTRQASPFSQRSAKRKPTFRQDTQANSHIPAKRTAITTDTKASRD